MSPDDLVPEGIPRPHPPRFTVFLVWLIIGLSLLLISGVIFIGISSSSTNTLVHHADCRARFQGQFDDHLAGLLREAVRDNPDPTNLDKLTASLQGDAREYQRCSGQSRARSKGATSHGSS